LSAVRPPQQIAGAAGLSLDELVSLDWETLLSLAGRHGVWPLVWRWAETLPAEAVPPAVRAELRQKQQGLAFHNLRLTGELWTLLELFAAHGIEALPVKGPTLAMLAFADVAGRQFGDLDLLVARRDVARASELLKSQGYGLQLDWTATHDPRFLEVTYDLEFFHRDKGFMVELHWALFPAYLGFAFEGNELRQRVIPVRPGGKPMQTLGPEDTLLYLCAHAAKHLWLSLKSVADLAWLLAAHAPWDWEKLLAEARARKVERVVLLGLLLAGQLLGAHVPVWVEQRAWAQRGFRPLFAQTVAALRQTPSSTGGMSRQFQYFFQLQQGWRERLVYVVRLWAAPNVGDWEWLPLAKPWQIFYVFLRPLRLAWQRLIGWRSPG
jgi:hypothetical protein